MKFFYTREKEDDSEIFSTPTTLKNRNRSKIGSLLVLLIFGLVMLMPSNMNSQVPGTVEDAFDLPDRKSCTSKDLSILSATLDVDKCECDEEGENYYDLVLGINNKTGSTRTSFAFWARLTISDNDPSTDDTVYFVNGCQGPIASKDVTTATFDALQIFTYDDVNDVFVPVYDPLDPNELLHQIPYTCGETIELTNVYQGWTDAATTPSRQCPDYRERPEDIAPKCGVTQSIPIEVGLSADSDKTDISCNDSNDGEILIDYNGGKAPYTIKFGKDALPATGEPAGASPIIYDNLSAGTYYWEITDSNDPACVQTGDETIINPPALNLAITSTDISCHDSADGIIELNDSADPPNDTFDSYELWKVVGNQDGVGNTENDDELQGTVEPDENGVFATNLSVGTYYIIGTKGSETRTEVVGEGEDAEIISLVDCYATSGPVTFTNPDDLNLAITSTGISCNGADDGVVSLDDSANPVNDTFDSYELWKVVGERDDDINGETDDTLEGSNTDGADFEDLSAGSYYVIGTKASATQDTLDCNAESGTETISDPDALNLEITSTGISCNGANDGIVSLDDSADPENDTFDSYALWKVVGERDDDINGETDDTLEGSNTDGADFEDLSAGSYYVIGTKASATQNTLDCNAESGTETISDSDALNLAITPTAVTCVGPNTGVLSLAVNPTPANDTFDSYILWMVVGSQDGVGNSETDDTNLGSVTPNAITGVFRSDLAAGSYYIIGYKASASQSTVNCTAIASATIAPATNCVGACETVFGYNVDTSRCFYDYPVANNRWGWTNLIAPGTTTTLILYGGAAQCDISKGTAMGTATITYLNGTITVVYTMYSGFVLNEAHVYIGTAPIPGKKGALTVAPGQYNYNPSIPTGGVTTLTVTANRQSGPKYVIVHGVACEISGAVTNLSKIAEEVSLVKPLSTNAKESGNLTLDSSFKVEQLSAYPVPFRETLNVAYDFDYESAAVIQLFDLQGRLLRTYKEANAQKGKVTELNIDFRTRASQVYILKVTTDRDVFTKKIISDK